SSEPTTATALGISGSSISERIKTKAPPSCHSNDVRPWNVVPGTSGCVAVVRHWPTNGASGSSAGLGRCASGPIGVAIRKIIADAQHGRAPGDMGHTPDATRTLTAVPDFATFDQRGYPTVSARQGYGAWEPSYEDTVLDLMDLSLLDRVETVR